MARKAAARRRSIQDFGPKIQHDGQIIGMVVADTFEAAREAAYKAKFSFNAEKPSAGFDSPGSTTKELSKKTPQAGDAPAAYENAAVKLDVAYGTPTEHHNPIELFTTTAVWDNGQLTIYEPSQFMYGLKNNAAKKMGIDPDQVHAISPFVGGAFGSKAQLTPRTGLVALAAQKLNRPVKLVATRDQGFTIATYRAETRHKIQIGTDKDGKIVSFQHRWVGSDLAAGRLFGCRGRRQRAALRLRHRQNRRFAGPCRPQHAGLHAFAAGRALYLRA